MGEHLFTTSLYTFSALVQADAAILSLGAIFIIFRLQSMEGSYQNALLSLSSDSFTSNLARHANRIAVTRSDPERAAILLGFQGSFYVSFLEIVAYTEHWKRKLIAQSTLPFLLLATHCAISAILFLRAPMFATANADEFRVLMIVDVSTFAALIFFIVSRAYRLVTFNSAERSESFENIDYPLPRNVADLQPLLPPDQRHYMYRFRLDGQRFYLLVFSKRKDMFSLNFLTYSDTERKILSQKTVENKLTSELQQVWDDFLANPKNYLQPSK